MMGTGTGDSGGCGGAWQLASQLTLNTTINFQLKWDPSGVLNRATPRDWLCAYSRELTRRVTSINVGTSKMLLFPPSSPHNKCEPQTRACEL
jgi:hypothetical protein